MRRRYPALSAQMKDELGHIYEAIEYAIGYANSSGTLLHSGVYDIIDCSGAYLHENAHIARYITGTESNPPMYIGPAAVEQSLFLLYGDGKCEAI